MNWRNRFSWILAALVCAGLLAGGLSLDAARGAGPVFEVFSDTLQQDRPAVAFNPATGSHLVVWNTAEDSYTKDVWGRPVLLDGTLLPAFNIDSIAGSMMSHVAIAADTARARFLVVNLYDDNSGFNLIEMYTVNWNGGQISLPVGFTTGSWWDYGEGPAVVYNPQADEYLLVYEDTTRVTCSYPMVVAMQVDPENLDLSTPVQVGGCNTDEWSLCGRVAYHPGSNRYQVIYERIGVSDSSNTLMTRWVSADLSQMGSPVEIAAYPHYTMGMAIASGPGGFLVVYVGEDYDGYYQVFGRFLDPNGNLLGSTIQISDEQVKRVNWNMPNLAFFGSLGYVVAWDFASSYMPPDVFDSFYRIVPDRPEPPHTTPMVLAASSSDESYPTVSCVPDNQCLLVYLDDLSGDYDVYGRPILLARQWLPLMVK